MSFRRPYRFSQPEDYGERMERLCGLDVAPRYAKAVVGASLPDRAVIAEPRKEQMPKGDR